MRGVPVTALLVLATDQDDAIDSIVASPTITRYRENGATITLVWPGAFQRIADHPPFDRLFVTLKVSAHPDATQRDTWVAACCTRVRGKDGRTPAQRIREEA
jgi:hypothetical protein